MPLNVDVFRNIANQTSFGSRDIAVQGQGKNATARLGNYVFSQGVKTNDATMAAFRDALEKEYGVFGANAFDSTLGVRRDVHKSLRAMDVKQTLTNLSQMRTNRFIAEIKRQLDTSPQLLGLPQGDRDKIRDKIAEDVLKDTDLKSCRTAADVGVAAQKRIAAAMGKVRKDSDLGSVDIGARQHLETEVAGTEPTGLRNLNTAFAKGETSIADLVKRGLAGRAHPAGIAAVRRGRHVRRDAPETGHEHRPHDGSGHDSARRGSVLFGDGGDHHVRPRLCDAPHDGRRARQLRAPLPSPQSELTAATRLPAIKGQC